MSADVLTAGGLSAGQTQLLADMIALAAILLLLDKQRPDDGTWRWSNTGGMPVNLKLAHGDALILVAVRVNGSGFEVKVDDEAISVTVDRIDNFDVTYTSGGVRRRAGTRRGLKIDQIAT